MKNKTKKLFNKILIKLLIKKPLNLVKVWKVNSMFYKKIFFKNKNLTKSISFEISIKAQKMKKKESR